MKRKVMVIAGAVIIALLLAAPVFAQNKQTVTTTATSNTSNATFTYFKTDVDNYMSYHSFGKVAFDKYFGFAGVGANIQAGYATNVAGLYLGLLYDGRVANKSETRTETITSSYNTGNGDLQSISTEVAYGNSYLMTDNGIAGIIGIGTMGIKFGFYEYTDVDLNKPNFTTTVGKNGDEFTYTGKVEDYENKDNTFVPYLGFGMTLDMGGMAVKPYLDVNFAINSKIRNQVYSTAANSYTEVYGVYNTRTLTAEGIAESYLRPDIMAGVNVTMGKLGFGIRYQIGFSIYNNDYDVYGITGDVKGTAAWNNASITENYGPIFDSINRNATVSMVEKSDMRHLIRPSVTYDIALNDTVSAGFGLLLPITIRSQTDTATSITYTYNELTYHSDPYLSTVTTTEARSYGGETSISTFTINPELYFGAKAAAVPSRLTVNGGVRIRPLAYTKTSTRIKPNGYDTSTTIVEDLNGKNITDTSTAGINDQEPDSLEVQKTWSWLNAAAGAGLCFSFTPSFSIDLSYVTGANFRLDSSDVSVLFSIKN